MEHLGFLKTGNVSTFPSFLHSHFYIQIIVLIIFYVDKKVILKTTKLKTTNIV
jgi:hypothetical protein